MEEGRWLLTVYDDRDRVLEESTHETLNDVAAVFGLPRGNDLFRYRTDPDPRHARRLMLDRFRVWFTVESLNDDSREDEPDGDGHDERDNRRSEHNYHDCSSSSTSDDDRSSSDDDDKERLDEEARRRTRYPPIRRKY